jgi:hypothetical protein
MAGPRLEHFVRTYRREEGEREAIGVNERHLKSVGESVIPERRLSRAVVPGEYDGKRLIRPYTGVD